MYLYEFRCISPDYEVTFVYVIAKTAEQAVERLPKSYRVPGALFSLTSKVSKLGKDWE